MEVKNLESETINNTNFRKVLTTTKNLQVVLMSLNPKEKIDAEIHKLSDQFFRVEQGNCEITIENITHTLTKDQFIIVPKNTNHEVLNSSNDAVLKLYTIYSPPHHPHGVIHQTKKDAEDSEKTNHEYLEKIKKYRNKLDKIITKIEENLG